MRDYAFASLEEIGEIDDGDARSSSPSSSEGTQGGDSDFDAIREEPGLKSLIAS